MEVVEPFTTRVDPTIAARLGLTYIEVSRAVVRRWFAGEPFVLTRHYVSPTLGKLLRKEGIPSRGEGTVIGAAQPRAGDSRVSDPRVALRQICAMMARSADAWNRGELDAFVADYMEGEGTTYIGSRGIVRGPAAIRAVYAPRFGPGGVRDSLSFERVEVDLLAPDLANTIAWYVLMRGDSVTARGPTSLVMRRVKGSWKIVHDHSS